MKQNKPTSINEPKAPNSTRSAINFYMIYILVQKRMTCNNEIMRKDKKEIGIYRFRNLESFDTIKTSLSDLVEVRFIDDFFLREKVIRARVCGVSVTLEFY